MSESERNIHRFIKKASASLVALSAWKGITRFVPAFLAAYGLLLGLDRWADLSLGNLQFLWTVFFAAAAAAFVSAFFPLRNFSLKEKSRHLFKNQSSGGRLRVDDLYLASQPLQGSPDLAQHFVDSVSAHLKSCRSIWCFPSWEWKKPTIAAAVLLFLAGALPTLFPSRFTFDTRVLFPFFAADLDNVLRVSPGDATVAWGSDVDVTVRVLIDTIHRPSLYVKVGSEWQSLEPVDESAQGSVFKIKNVVEPVVYRVVWKRDWSRRYTLEPAEPVRLSRFLIRMEPPAYLHKEASVQDSPEITGLSGSAVTMDVEANFIPTAAKLVFSDGLEKTAESISSGVMKFKFTLEKEGSYSFLFLDSARVWRGPQANYPLHVIQDQPPTLTLLSPDADLIIGEKEKLPLTYDARDDFGLQDVFLNIERNGRAETTERIHTFDKPLESALLTHMWDLGRAHFKPGDVIRYQLEVRDGNTVTGPGRAFSPWRIIEIAGFDAEHRAIEAALEDWRDKTTDLLAKVNTVKARLDGDKADADTLSKEFNEAAATSEHVEEYLKKIVAKMEEDPLADYGVWMEHKAMSENMRAMNSTNTRNAQAALQTGNKKAASSQMEQMASELERMLALSEDLSKAQRARDVLDASERMEKLGEELSQSLESGRIDAETKAQIDSIVAEAQKNLAAMARSLQEMPNDLPDDFVNQDALKNLEMGETKDILSQISDAVKRGDAAAAMQMAKNFLKMTQNMSKQLSDAHESFLKSKSTSDISEKLEEQKEKLDQVIKDQTDVLARTQRLESKRLEAYLKAQSELLGNLVERQEKVIRQTRETMTNHLLPPVALSMMSSQLGAMEQVQRELEKKRLDQTYTLLPAIASQMDNVKSELQRSSGTAAVVPPVEKIRTEELAILDDLKKPVSYKPDYSRDDQQEFSNLEKQQAELQKKTQGIKSQMQALSRRTANVGPQVIGSLGEAGNQMQEAAGKLHGNDSQLAKGHEEDALTHLLDGSAAMQQAMAGLSEMAQQQGGESGGGVQAVARPGGSLSAQGSRTGKVRLPKSEDYRPPKEFREDLLEALKEKYPKIYEDIIHKYYKRLAE